MSDDREPGSDRVLVIFPGALGDMICLLPALAALASRYPGLTLELMARHELAEFAVGRTPVARAHSIDRREVGVLFSADQDAAGRSAEFFGPFAAVHSFFGFDHPRIREVLPRACRGSVYFHPFRPQAAGHVSDAYLATIGEPAIRQHLENGSRMRVLPDDLEQARRALSVFDAQPGRFVLLMPGSGGRAKNWPAENYLQLARHLGRAIRVITVLGPAEAHLEAAFADLRPISNPSLGALAGLAKLSSAFAGNDSGVSHLAAASGARGVVIFGPTDPARWRPLGNVTVIRRMPLGDLPWRQVAQALEDVIGSAE